ncbi:MAG: DUF6291 domain-containing protein [Rikenellaceae bacterium]
MNTEHRDSFVFYNSFKQAIDELEDAQQLLLYQSISTYALYRQEPELEGITKVVWVLIKPQLDANWRKYEKGCRGGAPKGNDNASKTTIKQPSNNLKQPSNNLKQPNVNDNDNVNVNVNDLQTSIPPLLSEVTTFVSENYLDVDPQYFYDYYASNGWMIGKTPMIDWQATLRNWDRKTDKTNQTQTLQITLSNDL